MSRSSFTGGLEEICHFTLSPTFGKTLQHQYWEFKSRDENSLSPDEIYRSMTLVSRMSKFHTFNSHEALPSTEEKVLQHKHGTVKASSSKYLPSSPRWKEKGLSILSRSAPRGFFFSS